jgi:hypothetical protein
MCFSESDPAFSGRGKIRETPLGTTLYFSSEAELEKLYAPHFRVLELTTVEVGYEENRIIVGRRDSCGDHSPLGRLFFCR